MKESDLRGALVTTFDAVREAGTELKKHFGNVEFESKSKDGNIKDVVTELDRQTELFLAERLGKFSVEVGFRGEEFGVHSESETTWLVDPIDGTSHFIRGLPFCTTMVALIDHGKVVMSVIHDFVNENTYWATKGGGAFCNDNRIGVSNRPIGQSFLSFETRLTNPGNLKLFPKLNALSGLVQTINCGFELSMVASGKIDGRIAVDGYGGDWDYAPGSLLVAEAGGVVFNIGEEEYDYKNHDMMAVNPKVYESLTTGPGATFPLKPLLST